jgi:hypothetical protein
MLDTPLNRTIETFGACLDAAERHDTPWRHWLLTDALPDDVIDRVLALPYAAPEAGTFDGRRESNNSTRVFFGKEEQDRHPVCAELAALFHDEGTIAAIEKTCGVDLSKGQPRIEYTQDIDGFWLEPHTDIRVKLFTMLIYLSDDPALADAGTDIYDVTGKVHLGASPYGRNLGLIFLPGDDTWHGFEKRPIRGVRKSLIVNYVSPEWRAVEELA